MKIVVPIEIELSKLSIEDISDVKPLLIRDSSLEAVKQFLKGAMEVRLGTKNDQVFILHPETDGPDEECAISIKSYSEFARDGLSAVVKLEKKNKGVSKVKSHSHSQDNPVENIMQNNSSDAGNRKSASATKNRANTRHEAPKETGSMMNELQSAIQDLDNEDIEGSSNKTKEVSGDMPFFDLDTEIIDISQAVETSVKKKQSSSAGRKISRKKNVSESKIVEGKSLSNAFKSDETQTEIVGKQLKKSEKSASEKLQGKKTSITRKSTTERELNLAEVMNNPVTNNNEEANLKIQVDHESNSNAEKSKKRVSKSSVPTKASVTKKAQIKTASKRNTNKKSVEKNPVDIDPAVKEFQETVDTSGISATVLRVENGTTLVCLVEDASSTRIKNKLQMLTGKDIKLLSKQRSRSKSKDNSDVSDQDNDLQESAADRKMLIDSYLAQK